MVLVLRQNRNGFFAAAGAACVADDGSNDTIVAAPDNFSNFLLLSIAMIDLLFKFSFTDFIQAQSRHLHK